METVSDTDERALALRADQKVCQDVPHRDRQASGDGNGRGRQGIVCPTNKPKGMARQ